MLTEYQASHSANGGVTIRQRRTVVARYRFRREIDAWYGETPEAAVEKFIVRMQAAVERAREELQAAEQPLARGEQLRQVEPLDVSRVVRPCGGTVIDEEQP
jgi:hypothetical protein